MSEHMDHIISLRVDLNPLEQNFHQILGSKRDDRFANHFFELVQKTCQVRFSYLLRHGYLCKGPRTLRKFLQKCQKIAGCDECAVYASRPLIASKPRPSPPERPSKQITRITHGLTQLVPVPPLQYFVLSFSKKTR